MIGPFGIPYAPSTGREPSRLRVACRIASVVLAVAALAWQIWQFS